MCVIKHVLKTPNILFFIPTNIRKNIPDVMQYLFMKISLFVTNVLKLSI